MTRAEFVASLNDFDCPKVLSIQMQSLWLDAKGDWHNAHDLIDHLEDPISAHIHAYLHRVEGDIWNARYWYRKANKEECRANLKSEWNELVDLYL